MFPQRYEYLKKEPAPKLLLEALKMFDVKEDLSKESNPTILAWAKECGLDKVYSNDSIPWCGLFMAVIVLRTGRVLPDSPLWALSWAKFGIEVKTPMLGDILVFTRKGGGHVAIYVGEDKYYYHILGGNQSDKVCIVRKSKKELFKAVRPNYISQPKNVRRIFVSPNGDISSKED